MRQRPRPDAEIAVGGEVSRHYLTWILATRLLGERLQSGLFGLDIRLAYDAAVLLVLFAKMRAEVHAAHSDRKEPKVD